MVGENINEIYGKPYSPVAFRLSRERFEQLLATRGNWRLVAGRQTGKTTLSMFVELARRRQANEITQEEYEQKFKQLQEIYYPQSNNNME